MTPATPATPVLYRPGAGSRETGCAQEQLFLARSHTGKTYTRTPLAHFRTFSFLSAPECLKTYRASESERRLSPRGGNSTRSLFGWDQMWTLCQPLEKMLYELELSDHTLNPLTFQFFSRIAPRMPQQIYISKKYTL